MGIYSAVHAGEWKRIIKYRRGASFLCTEEEGTAGHEEEEKS